MNVVTVIIGNEYVCRWCCHSQLQCAKPRNRNKAIEIQQWPLFINVNPFAHWWLRLGHNIYISIPYSQTSNTFNSMWSCMQTQTGRLLVNKNYVEQFYLRVWPKIQLSSWNTRTKTACPYTDYSCNEARINDKIFHSSVTNSILYRHLAHDALLQIVFIPILLNLLRRYTCYHHQPKIPCRAQEANRSWRSTINTSRVCICFLRSELFDSYDECAIKRLEPLGLTHIQHDKENFAMHTANQKENWAENYLNNVALKQLRLYSVIRLEQLKSYAKRHWF